MGNGNNIYRWCTGKTLEEVHGLRSQSQSYFRDDPVYLAPKKGEWISPIGQCQLEINPIANGVFIWTETKGAGHVFVSVHDNNNAYVYTYGRFGRRWFGSLLGDGILNFLKYEDARMYYRNELYRMEANVFRIDDADILITRNYFERLWEDSVPVIQTSEMRNVTKARGKIIDQYDVTGKNCTTHTTDGIKFSGSSVFEAGYTTNSQMRVELEEDFSVPVSLQRFLMRKSTERSLQVIDITSVFKKQYPNIDNLSPVEETPGSRGKAALAEIASALGYGSSYSGGSVGGLLGGFSDANP
ncbi:hypothetical protein J5069_08715 [Candidatus Symbiopectobacterium sp. NZEC127]|uniref:hypothetical protein n=1 Tax=Candidatus Symbiopectobacterium sp. NZEC127 TaxID=2820472 RepID=UPI002225C120|nr:hypothetical protein [Candidatus Symbiopectobacterium sp. NZEC127]MCW2485975.1 hypothetical protein [Candidatus Symbiopectobacterium sp. NZEC127]